MLYSVGFCFVEVILSTFSPCKYKTLHYYTEVLLFLSPIPSIHSHSAQGGHSGTITNLGKSDHTMQVFLGLD